MYRTKFSALGGNGSDKSFEESVANLAHEFLNDKAPTLMKDELGFQLLDKSDDDSKGVGVCVFKPNGILMFAPIFFLNGEIKGHELLFLPDQDLFVPLKETWINEIIGKKPAMIGDTIDKSFQRRNGALQPDLSIFKVPPKMASYLNPAILAQEPYFVPKLKKYIEHTGVSFDKTASLLVNSLDTILEATNLKKFFKYASNRGLKKLNRMIQGSVLTKRAFANMYPGIDLAKIASSRDSYKRSREFLKLEPNPSWREEMFPKKNAGYVSIISYSATISNGNDFDLSEDEKERLAKQQYLVLDSRKDGDVAKIVRGPQQLTTPSETGVYSALMADGSFKDIVVIRRVDLNTKYKTDTNPTCIVFTPDEHDNGTEFAVNTIFTKEKYPQDRFERWYKSLTDCNDYHYLNTTSGLNFINAKGACYGDVWGRVTRYENVIKIQSGFSDKGLTVEIGGKWNRELKRRGDILYVPENCKVFSVNSDTELLFGRPEILLHSDSQDFKTIKLSTAQDWCTINERKYPTKFAGFCSLIKDYGLREKDAKSLFKQAEANIANYHTASIYVKKADSIINPELNKRPESDMYFPDEEEGNTSIFGDMLPVAPNSMQAVQTGETFLAPNSGPYENTLNDPYPADEMQQVQQALQSGQDEVFNLSALKQFLNDGDLSSEVDHEIPELIRGMNHAGRMLFRYYWKGDKFKELYGPQEMPELESSLRKVFELLGDVVLLLKHKLKKDDTYGELSRINLADLNE